jgi:hypothetical protein
MDLFDTCTWADFVEETTFLDTHTVLLPKSKPMEMIYMSRFTTLVFLVVTILCL